MPTGQISLMPTLRRFVLAGTAAERTDGQLLGAFIVDHDADAFGLLVRRHGPMVLGVCRRLIGDHANAEDAFQAVFLVLARRSASVKPREQVGNWLYGVAYRTALKARAVLARRRSREKQVDVMPEAPVPSPPDEWADLQPIIDEELSLLPEKLRVPVVLCDLQGRPQREVARTLGLPPATLATRLALARRTLAQRLTKRGITLSGGVLAGLLTVHGASAAVPVTLLMGLTRAAEAIAAGTTYSGLVSAGAIQLSEGVMRMMMLTKLKAITVVALTAIAITGGLGLGLAPAYADGIGDEPAPAAKATRAAVPTAKTVADWKQRVNAEGIPLDDATYLRRLCLDIRGTMPTDIETFFFISDEDENKRTKVVDWLLDDGLNRAAVAKQFGVPVEQVHVVRLPEAKDGKAGPVVMLVEIHEPKPRVVTLTVSPDGKTPASEVDRAVLSKWVVESKAAGDIVRERWGAFFQTTDGRPATPPAATARLKTAGEKESLNTELMWTLEVKDATPGTMTVGEDVADVEAQRVYRLWTLAAGQTNPQPQQVQLYFQTVDVESDLDFLKRVTTAARGTAPTSLEEKYFSEDKDTKKREKLIDTLLKEPTVAKKLGDDFKKKMLAAVPGDVLKSRTFHYEIVPAPSNPKGVPQKPIAPMFLFDFQSKTFDVPALPSAAPKAPAVPTPPPAVKPPVTPKPPVPPVAPQGNRHGKLIEELLAAKKSDAEMLEAVTLVTVGRLPTDTEKRLTLGLVAKAADRKAAWLEVAKALSATNDGGEHFEMEFKFVPSAPNPPAKR